ncbi:MAG: protein-export chaperone SecB [Maritimibacter sp.]|nr:protein-export chaperone SecB [Maritimibacter sp.]
MADEDAITKPQDQAAPAQPKMQVLGQFIRDMSFENILSQKGAKGEVKPELKVEVALDAKKRTVENQFEVITKFKVNSQNQGGGEPLFLLELDYAGIFQIENVPEEHLAQFLLIECPRMLFPFVRRIVSDITRDGGFPPVNLDSVDFVALYRQEIARRAAAGQAASPTPAN